MSPTITWRRFIGMLVGIGLAAMALALAGHLVLGWPRQAVMTWLSLGTSYLAGGLAIRLMPRWWREHIDDEYAQPAGRRYARTGIPVMGLYVVTLIASLSLIKRGIASLPLRALVAIVPALSIFLLMRAALRYFREADELQRRIEPESIGASAMLVSLVYFAAGLLQKAQVIEVHAATAMIWVFPMMMLAYAVTKFLAIRHYR